MGFMTTPTGWTNYGGPDPWAAGIGSFADNFAKMYAVAKGLSLEESRQALQDKLAQIQLQEAAREQAFREKAAKMFQPETTIVNTPPPKAPVPTQSPLDLGLRQAGGPLTATPDLGLMPPQAAPANTGQPVDYPFLPGSTQKTVTTYPKVTPEAVMGLVLEHGTPREGMGLLGQLFATERLVDTLANKRELADARNLNEMLKAQMMSDAKINQALIAAQSKGSNADASTARVLGFIIQGNMRSLESDKRSLVAARANAIRKEDREKLDAQIADIDAQLKDARSQLSSLGFDFAKKTDQNVKPQGKGGTAIDENNLSNSAKAAIEYMKGAKTEAEAIARAKALKDQQWSRPYIEFFLKKSGWE